MFVFVKKLGLLCNLLVHLAYRFLKYPRTNTLARLTITGLYHLYATVWKHLRGGIPSAGGVPANIFLRCFSNVRARGTYFRKQLVWPNLPSQIQNSHLNFGWVTCHFINLKKKIINSFLVICVYERVFYTLYWKMFVRNSKG